MLLTQSSYQVGKLFEQTNYFYRAITWDKASKATSSGIQEVMEFSTASSTYLGL